MRFLLLLILLSPFFVFAAPRDFGELVDIFITVINSTIIPVLFAISLVAFLWGVAQYNIFSSSEEKKTSGRQIMVWGIIAFVVMVLVWGIVKIINASLFGLGADYSQIEEIDTSGEIWDRPLYEPDLNPEHLP